MRIRFGTDGWRGVISRDFTFDNLRRMADAVAAFLEESGLAARGVAVGYDRRFLSAEYAAEAAGVLAARGIRVLLADRPVPTPLVSWAVRHLGLGGGLVITASHNPPEWSGVKFKEPQGCAARERTSRRIEALLERAPEGRAVPCLGPGEARRRGLLERLDVWDPYREALWGFVDREHLRRRRPRVAVDAMHGCAWPWLGELLDEAGCRVTALRTEHNPGFGGIPPEPLEEHLGGLMEAVAREGALVGLANDGDADRIGAVDERGRYFSTQRIFAVLLHHLLEDRDMAGRVVRSVSGTAMADLLCARRGLELVVTPIGFKHIGEAVAEPGTLIGGEESGGIAIPAFLPERDGLLNALLLVALAVQAGGLRRDLDRVFAVTGPFTYRRVDVPLDPADRPAVVERIARLTAPSALSGRPVVRAVRIDGLRLERDDGSWLLVRASGTEPKLRFYAEGRSPGDVDSLLAEGRRMVGV